MVSIIDSKSKYQKYVSPRVRCKSMRHLNKLLRKSWSWLFRQGDTLLDCESYLVCSTTFESELPTQSKPIWLLNLPCYWYPA